MGKEAELLKAVKEKDSNKVQKLLTASVKKTRQESLSWQSVDSGHKIQVELRHINVNIQEASTGYTPLLLAVLNDSQEIAERLIFHCADVNIRDNKGNTALHLAAFNGSSELVGLLIFNKAEVNAQNEDGNTPLHILCQAAVDERVKIITKLVNAGSNVWMKNKYNITALDVCAQFRRNEAIVTLLELTPTLQDNRTAIIEAAIRGFESTVELLLEYGLSCNRLDEQHGSSALHEAVRFNRIDVAKILLDFQADSNLLNLKKETPRSIAAQLNSHTGEKFNQLFEAQAEKLPRIPKMIKLTEDPSSPQGNVRKPGFMKDYPELPNDITWTQNRPLFCSSCTEKNPNSHILDENLRTFWVIPVLHNAWNIFDFHSEHIITGTTIYGWNSPQMLKTFQLQTSQSIEGPWTVVSSHTCELLGSPDPKEPAFPQKFGGFTFRSRYIRLYIVDNHGGSCICFQGIRFHGADCRVIDTLQECGLYKSIDSFIHQEMNTWEKFLDITQEAVDNLVADPGKKVTLWTHIYKGRKIMYPMTYLTWVSTPPLSVFVGDVMPDFIVQSDRGVTEVVQLSASGAELLGDTFRRLAPLGEGKPSIATFSNISVRPAGMYLLCVKGVTTDITLISPTPTEVRPEVRSPTDISSAFDEIQQILSEVEATLNSPLPKEHKK